MSVLKSMLTAVETSGDKSWQDALGEVQLAINCTLNRVTKASPLELLIGKVARPLSLMCSEVDNKVNIESVRETALENIQRRAGNVARGAIETGQGFSVALALEAARCE